MFYTRFLDLCRQKGISPAAAAREMGFSNSTTTQWAHGAIPSMASLSKIAAYFNVSIDFLRTGNGDSVYDTESISIEAPESGVFQFDRFVQLCKSQGKKQSHLYELVGLPSKAGSNLKRTKKVKPEILAVWAAELNTSVAYLNGETDDPSPVTSTPAPAEQKENAPQSAADRLTEGLNEESIKKLYEYAKLLKLGQESADGDGTQQS